MSFSRTLSTALLTSAAAANLLAAGCASAPPVAEKMVVPPMGTVTTFHRKSSGSLGTFDGQVVWTYTQSTFQCKPGIAYSAPQAGIALLDPATFGMLAYLNAAGQPTLSFDPPITYPWPLHVGKTATQKLTTTMYPSGTKVPITIDLQGRVVGKRSPCRPARSRPTGWSWTDNFGEVETRWLNPMEGSRDDQAACRAAGEPPRRAQEC